MPSWMNVSCVFLSIKNMLSLGIFKNAFDVTLDMKENL